MESVVLRESNIIDQSLVPIANFISSFHHAGTGFPTKIFMSKSFVMKP